MVLFIQGLLNTFSVRLVALLNDVSVYWHLIGVAIIFILLFWAPSSGSHQTVSFLFGSEGWNAFKGLSGFSIPFYVFLIGLLNAQYTFTGYDASAHVSEETIDARISAPKGIVNSIWTDDRGLHPAGGRELCDSSRLPGHHQRHRVQSDADIAVDLVPWATIFIFAAGKAVGMLLILVVIVAQFFCGMSSITANSRMVYAFSRDGAVPFSNFWHHVSKGSHVPVRTAWFGAVGAFILGSAVHGQHDCIRSRDLDRGHRPLHLISDPGLPPPHQPDAFHPGPWVLSKTWGPIINWLAIIWVVFIVILLCCRNTAWSRG